MEMYEGAGKRGGFHFGTRKKEKDDERQTTGLLSTLFRENFCANISVKLKNTYYILMSKMAAILVLSRLMPASQPVSQAARQPRPERKVVIGIANGIIKMMT